MTDQQLIDMSIRERIKHAPYKIFIQTEVTTFFVDPDEDIILKVDDIKYRVIRTWNCLGYHEIVTLSP